MTNSLYRHRWQNGNEINLVPSKAVCVGRNYVAHAKELNNPIPDQPLLFIKPTSAFLSTSAEIRFPVDLGTIHYECELVVLIGKQMTRVSKEQALEYAAGVGLGLDLTLRELQGDLKAKGYPWERAKAFDGSCILGPFKRLKQQDELINCDYRLFINDELKQHGDTQLMIYSIAALLSDISHAFTLFPGDVVMTGTPAGVGVLNHNDALRLELAGCEPVNMQFKQS